MTGFQPVVPVSGYPGWLFLERTAPSQKEAFNSSAQIERDIAYFAENVSKATTAEDLVSDRQLLRIALSAFGLEDDLDKKAYVLKVLKEGTDDERSFANRIADKRYRDFAKAFGYGNYFGARIGQSDFVSKITSAYKERQFEVAVGNSDQSMRMAMTFIREIPKYANSQSADTAAWFEVMGNPPIKNMFETAFGLPSSFGGLDVDKQREIFKEKFESLMGNSSLEVFKEEANVKKFLQTFFVRQQITQTSAASTGNTTALTLLQNSSLGSASLFQSLL